MNTRERILSSTWGIWTRVWIWLLRIPSCKGHMAHIFNLKPIWKIKQRRKSKLSLLLLATLSLPAFFQTYCSRVSVSFKPVIRTKQEALWIDSGKSLTRWTKKKRRNMWITSSVELISRYMMECLIKKPCNGLKKVLLLSKASLMKKKCKIMNHSGNFLCSTRPSIRPFKP